MILPCFPISSANLGRLFPRITEAGTARCEPLLLTYPCMCLHFASVSSGLSSASLRLFLPVSMNFLFEYIPCASFESAQLGMGLGSPSVSPFFFSSKGCFVFQRAVFLVTKMKRRLSAGPAPPSQCPPRALRLLLPQFRLHAKSPISGWSSSGATVLTCSCCLGDSAMASGGEQRVGSEGPLRAVIVHFVLLLLRPRSGASTRGSRVAVSWTSHA